MAKTEMVQWEEDKKLVLYRIDQLDKKVDKLETHFDEVQESFSSQGKQIDNLRVDILKLVTENKVDLGLFKKEFQLKNISRAYLGTILAIATAVVGYFLKNLFV